MRTRMLFAAAILTGLAIAYMDSRPHFDDAGITAGLLLLSAGAFALMAPARPGLWSLAVGIWIPAHAMVQHPDAQSLAMLLVLVFPLAGAYAGLAVRLRWSLF